MIKYVLQEAEILKELQHKNIIGYKHAYYDKKTKMFYLLLEYAQEGDLEGLFKKQINMGDKKYMDEKRILRIFKQITEGV